MYKVGGISLDNPGRGWGVDDRTKTIPELTRALQSVAAQGRDGVISMGPGVVQAPIWPLYVRTTAEGREPLLALVQGSSELSLGSKTLAYTVAGVSVVDDDFSSATSVVMFSLRLDGVFWRGGVATSAAASLSSSSVTAGGLLSGLSAPVQDALVRVKGAVSGLVVTDSAGAWFTYAGSVSTSQWLRFESDSGRAFITTSDTWVGGTDVSGDIDYGGPRGLFEIGPAWSADPAERAGSLTVATSSRSGASIQVRGRAAFAA